MKRTNTAVWLEKYNRWQIKVQKDGKRKTFTCSTPGRKGQRECNAKADAWLDNNIENANVKVEALYDEYIVDLKARTSFSHWRKEYYCGKSWIIPHIGNMKIDKINDKHLQDIINIAFKSELSKKSLTNIRATLNAFFKFCRKCKVTTFCPEDIVIPKGAKVGEKTILQPNELKILFTVDTTVINGQSVYDNYINAYRFQVITGLRPGELVGLNKNDIKNTTVIIKRSINIFGEETTGKNENAKRKFTLTSLAEQILAEQEKIETEYDNLFGIESEADYRNKLKAYCKANNISVVTPYELRHTFVSAVQSLPEGQIKAIVGHSKSMDTFGTYAHATDGLNDVIATNVNSVFSKILDNDTDKKQPTL